MIDNPFDKIDAMGSVRTEENFLRDVEFGKCSQTNHLAPQPPQSHNRLDFQNQSHFGTFFKRKTGLSPKAFKQQVK